MDGIFQTDTENRGLIFDPRTKLFLMVTICIFVIGGVGTEYTMWPSRILGLLPLLLLCTAGYGKKAAIYGALYCSLEGIQIFLFPGMRGALQIFCAVFLMFVLRLMPGIMMGAYLLATTTVSEFIAAMERMHIPGVITIPMSVMFRLFPTVLEEFGAVNAAVKMRDIRIGGRNAGKIVEYRIVPLIVCSVNIGNELSAAALTRGLCGKTKRTNICEIGFHGQDVLVFIAAILPYVIFLLMKLEVMG